MVQSYLVWVRIDVYLDGMCSVRTETCDVAGYRLVLSPISELHNTHLGRWVGVRDPRTAESGRLHPVARPQTRLREAPCKSVMEPELGPLEIVHTSLAPEKAKVLASKVLQTLVLAGLENWYSFLAYLGSEQLGRQNKPFIRSKHQMTVCLTGLDCVCYLGRRHSTEHLRSSDTPPDASQMGKPYLRRKAYLDTVRRILLSNKVAANDKLIHKVLENELSFCVKGTSFDMSEAGKQL